MKKFLLLGVLYTMSSYAMYGPEDIDSPLNPRKRIYVRPLSFQWNLKAVLLNRISRLDRFYATQKNMQEFGFGELFRTY